MSDVDLIERQESPQTASKKFPESFKKYLNNGVAIEKVSEVELNIALSFYETFPKDMKVELAQFRELEKLVNNGEVMEFLSKFNVFHTARYKGFLYGLGYMDTDSKLCSVNTLNIPDDSLFFDKYLERMGYSMVKSIYTQTVMMHSLAFDHQLLSGFTFDEEGLTIGNLYSQMRDMQTQIHNIVKNIGIYAQSSFSHFDTICASPSNHVPMYLEFYDQMHGMTNQTLSQLEYLKTVASPSDVIVINDSTEKVQELLIRFKTLKQSIDKNEIPDHDPSLRFIYPAAQGVH